MVLEFKFGLGFGWNFSFLCIVIIFYYVFVNILVFFGFEKVFKCVIYFFNDNCYKINKSLEKLLLGGCFVLVIG